MAPCPSRTAARAITGRFCTRTQALARKAAAEKKLRDIQRDCRVKKMLKGAETKMQMEAKVKTIAATWQVTKDMVIFKDGYPGGGGGAPAPAPAPEEPAE